MLPSLSYTTRTPSSLINIQGLCVSINIGNTAITLLYHSGLLIRSVLGRSDYCCRFRQNEQISSGCELLNNEGGGAVEVRRRIMAAAVISETCCRNISQFSKSSGMIYEKSEICLRRLVDGCDCRTLLYPD